MKTVVLGGSTPHTVALVEALLDIWTEDHPKLSLHLLGRDRDRLAAVHGFCVRRATARGAANLTLHSTTDPEAACDGADLIVFQVRAGGLEGRSQDESFPLSFSIPGDEGLGPGGLAAAIRSFPVIDRLAAALPEPGNRLVLMLTNPLGLCCRRLQSRWPGAVLGVCELPELTLEKALGHPQDTGTVAEYSGMNHQGFWHRIEQDGIDRLPRILADQPRWARKPELQGTLPLPYLRLYFDREAVCAEQNARDCRRAEELQKLNRRLLRECVAEDGRRPLPSASIRATPWYGRVVVRAIDARAHGMDLNLMGTMSAGPDHSFAGAEGMVEREVQVGEGFRALPDPPCPAALQPFLHRLATAEDLAWTAADRPSLENVEQALRAHPLCDHLADDACRALSRACLQAGGRA